MSEQPGIVDGHGPDATHPPGPELRRLADAMRLVADQTVRTAAAPDVLADAAAAVERAAAILAPHTPAWAPSVPAMPATELDPHVYFPFSPIIGWYSPLAPPIQCVPQEGGGVVGHGALGAAYEGPPGCVHGGMIAEIFDEMLGVANITAGVGAMTGTLTIVYRSPTPLYTELRFEAETESIEGRKVHTRGTLHAGDRLCAEAHGIFIQVARENFADHALGHGGRAQ
ncbi:MAG TPA: PaaI family thioesterase [Acidimicrobiia bacterium]|nr:PaaI family thioesterase [Acidimicrobiia bacterium]